MPIIVIAPDKTHQSYSSVGSQVTVVDSETIKNSTETFLTDLLDNQSQGLNIFQVGGVGTVNELHIVSHHAFQLVFLYILQAIIVNTDYI